MKLPITLIISNFNGKHYLDMTLPAWQCLPFQDIIIADACSEEVPVYPQISTISGDQPGGKNSAVWAAVSAARTSYVLLVDNDLTPDACFDLGYMLAQAQLLKSSITVPIFNCGQLKTKYYGRSFGCTFLQPQTQLTLQEIQHFGTRKVGMFSGTLLIEREIFLRVGGYLKSLKFGGDDNVLSLRLREHKQSIYLLPSSTLTHHGISNRRANSSAVGWWHHVYIAHWCIQAFWEPKLFRYTSHICTAFYLFGNMIVNCILYRNPRYLLAYFLGYYKYFTHA